MKKSADLLKGTPHKSDYCSVLINLCAIYSSLRNHIKAIEVVKIAIVTSLELIELNEMDDEGGKEVISALYIGYYNLAVEFEFIGERVQSLHFFERAKCVYNFLAERIDATTIGENFAMICNKAIANLTTLMLNKNILIIKKPVHNLGDKKPSSSMQILPSESVIKILNANGERPSSHINLP
jgi:hypothetical protein